MEGGLSRLLVGVISDTHGLLREEVFAAFRGVERILHAGDVGDPDILVALEAVAPVDAVWGNVDGFEVRARAREVVAEDLAGVPVAVIHGHQVRHPEELPAHLPAARVIVHGHSHQPLCRQIGGTLLLNPGSAGPKRFGDPVSVALLELTDGRIRARHLDLQTLQPFDPGGG